MGAHSCSLKEPIKLLTQKGAPLSRKVLLPMLTAKVLTPDQVALYSKRSEGKRLSPSLLILHT